MTTIQRVIRTKTTVSPDGILHLADLSLTPGDYVEVMILLSEEPDEERQSALDILAQAPGKRIFKIPEEVDTYIAEERASWERDFTGVNS